MDAAIWAASELTAPGGRGSISGAAIGRRKRLTYQVLQNVGEAAFQMAEEETAQDENAYRIRC